MSEVLNPWRLEQLVFKVEQYPQTIPKEAGGIKGLVLLAVPFSREARIIDDPRVSMLQHHV